MDEQRRFLNYEEIKPDPIDGVNSIGDSDAVDHENYLIPADIVIKSLNGSDIQV